MEAFEALKVYWHKSFKVQFGLQHLRSNVWRELQTTQILQAMLLRRKDCDFILQNNFTY